MTMWVKYVGAAFAALAVSVMLARTPAAVAGPGGGSGRGGALGGAGGGKGGAPGGSGAGRAGGGGGSEGGAGKGVNIQQTLDGSHGEYKVDRNGNVSLPGARGFGGRRAADSGNSGVRVKSKEERTVGPGVVKDRHNLNASKKEDRADSFKREVSGLTPQERARFGNDYRAAAHTEPKHLRDVKVQPRETVVLVGQKQPCNRCQGEIRKFVERTGNPVEYKNREGGTTVRREWERQADGTVQRTTSKFNRDTGARENDVKVHNGKRWRDSPQGGQ
jgi:hypothetical protein